MGFWLSLKQARIQMLFQSLGLAIDDRTKKAKRTETRSHARRIVIQMNLDLGL